MFISKSFRTIVFVKFLKLFPRLNHFYAQINRGHLRKAGGYSGQNIVKKNNKDEDNSPKTLIDKNHQASSQRFRQLK